MRERKSSVTDLHAQVNKRTQALRLYLQSLKLRPDRLDVKLLLQIMLPSRAYDRLQSGASQLQRPGQAGG